MRSKQEANLLRSRERKIVLVPRFAKPKSNKKSHQNIHLDGFLN